MNKLLINFDNFWYQYHTSVNVLPINKTHSRNLWAKTIPQEQKAKAFKLIDVYKAKGWNAYEYLKTVFATF